MSDRQRTYERSRLAHEQSAFSASWARADGRYNWSELERLAESYPETTAIYDRANTQQPRGAA